MDKTSDPDRQYLNALAADLRLPSWDNVVSRRDRWRLFAIVAAIVVVFLPVGFLIGWVI